MTINRSDDAYDPPQVAFVNHMVDAVYAEAKAAGAEGDLLREVVARTCFYVATMLDGDNGLDVAEDQMYPMLVFMPDEGSDTAIAPDRTGWMHEYVHSAVNARVARDRR